MREDFRCFNTVALLLLVNRVMLSTIQMILANLVCI